MLLKALIPAILISSVCHAKTIYFGSETESVTLVYGSPALFRFPNEVKTITQATRFDIKPANVDSPNYSVLSIQPRFTSGSSLVTFILNDGTLVRTKLSVISKVGSDLYDGVFDFKTKESLLNGAQGGEQTAKISDLELMKAVIRDDEISGYSVSRLNQTVSPGFRGVETKLVKRFTGKFNAYVFEITNITKNKLLVNIQNLMLGDPNLAIMASVDVPILEPRGKDGSKTYLRVVAKSTSQYAKLILPIQIVETGVKQ